MRRWSAAPQPLLPYRPTGVVLVLPVLVAIVGEGGEVPPPNRLRAESEP
jgi:hypothetical protein